MFDADNYMITVVELSTFDRVVKDILTPEERAGLITYVASHPDDGDVIPHTGGLRKLRWGGKGRGKRGGVRVIYYFRDLNMPVYLITAFSKGEKIDLTGAEKRQMRALIDRLVSEYWERQVEPLVSLVSKRNA